MHVECRTCGYCILFVICASINDVGICGCIVGLHESTVFLNPNLTGGSPKSNVNSKLTVCEIKTSINSSRQSRCQTYHETEDKLQLSANPDSLLGRCLRQCREYPRQCQILSSSQLIDCLIEGKLIVGIKL